MTPRGPGRIARFHLRGAEFLVISRQRDDLRARYGLTAAEAAVARMVIEGRTNAEIAAARGTSARTVANQARAVFEKIGVTSRRALVREVARAVASEGVPPAARRGRQGAQSE